MRAAVVVDVSSIAHAIGRLRGGGRRYPSIERLCDALYYYGVEPVELQVGIVTTPIELTATNCPEAADRRADVVRRDRAWLAEQLRWAGEVGLALRALEGAHDGTREVGVDGLCVLAALEASQRISARSLDAECVLVVTHDRDLDVIPGYASPVPTYIVGQFDDEELRSLRQGRVPHVALTRRALVSLDPEVAAFDDDVYIETVEREGRAAYPRGTALFPQGSQVLAVEGIGGELMAMSSPLADTPPSSLPDVASLNNPTIGVLDAFGIMNVATHAIGVAHLPAVEDVRACLERLKWRGDAAVLATVPDVRTATLERANMFEGERKAWRWLDEVLDRYAQQVEGDSDPATLASRGHILPERRDQFDPTMRAVAKKRVAELILADTYMAARQRPDADVVVFSDSVDVAFALQQLPDFGVELPERVVRVGVHGSLFDVESTGHGLPEPRWRRRGWVAPFMLLTEGLLADLVGVGDRPHGRRFRSDLVRSVRNADRWRIVRWDPVARGVVVSPDVAPELEVSWPDALFLFRDLIDVVPDREIEAQRFTLDLTFNPRLPCAVPVLQHGRAAQRNDIAVVVERDAHTISIDMDGDFVPDAKIAISHEGAELGVGDTVIVRRITKDEDGWFLVSVVEQGDEETGEPHVVEVTRSDGATTVRCTVDDIEGELLTSSEVPEPTFATEPGDRLFALEVTVGERRGFLPLSTPLWHLSPGERAVSPQPDC